MQLPLMHSELCLAVREHIGFEILWNRKDIAGMGEDRCYRAIEGRAWTGINQRNMMALKKEPLTLWGRGHTDDK